jgi:ribonuclease P protein component
MTVRRGRRVRSGAVVVHHLPDSDRTQATVVVGRTLGPAVVRHHRQRQLRHALAHLWEDMPAGALVVRALPQPATYDQLLDDLRRAVRTL